MIPEVKGECEEFNNSPQIPKAVTTDGRPLIIYVAKRVWRPRVENERVETLRAEREPCENGNHGTRRRYIKPQGAGS